MFSENLHGRQEFYTTTSRTGRAKYQLWLSPCFRIIIIIQNIIQEQHDGWAWGCWSLVGRIWQKRGQCCQFRSYIMLQCCKFPIFLSTTGSVIPLPYFLISKQAGNVASPMFSYLQFWPCSNLLLLLLVPIHLMTFTFPPPRMDLSALRSSNLHLSEQTWSTCECNHSSKLNFEMFEEVNLRTSGQL